jgi:hypothetical protein
MMGTAFVPECIAELQKWEAAKMPSAAELLARFQNTPTQTLLSHSLSDWGVFVSVVLARLKTPKTRQERIAIVRDAQAVTRALAADPAQPEEIRKQAEVTSIKAGDFVTRAELQATIQQAVSEAEDLMVGRLEREFTKLNKRIDRVSREESQANVRLEIKRLFEAIRHGAKLCVTVPGNSEKSDFDRYFSSDDMHQLRGAWLADYFNGARFDGAEAGPLLKQGNGDLYKPKTLERYFNRSPENFAKASEGGTSKTTWTKLEMLRLVDKWVLADRAQANTNATTAPSAMAA